MNILNKRRYVIKIENRTYKVGLLLFLVSFGYHFLFNCFSRQICKWRSSGSPVEISFRYIGSYVSFS